MSNKLKKKTTNNNSSYNKVYTSGKTGFIHKFYCVLQKEKNNIDMKSHSRKNVIDSITMILIEIVIAALAFSKNDILYNIGFPAGYTSIMFSMALVFFSVKDIIKSIVRIKNKEATTANKIIVVINSIFAITGLISIIYLIVTKQVTI